MEYLLIRFILGGLIYMGIEVIYDNTSHRSMGLVGGIAFVLCSRMIGIGMPYWFMALAMAMVITALELIAGEIFNRDYKIWDYRKMPLNIDGQVCLPFFLVWLLVMPPVIVWLHNLLPT